MEEIKMEKLMQEIEENKDENSIKIYVLEEEDVNDYFLKENKEKKKGYNQTYYNKHKTELLDKIKVKVPCDICDKLISKSNLLRHKKKCDEKIRGTSESN
jgi:hypothetical protein